MARETEQTTPRRAYRSPEMMRLGAAVDVITKNEKGILADGGMKPNGYKDVEWQEATPPEATADPEPRD